jgi:hypothetical protein
MLKDIPELKVEDVAFAVVRKAGEDQEEGWYVYLINMQDQPIEGVLVTSNGYGKIDDYDRKSSTLRHFLDVLPAKSYALIEPIVEDVFMLSNEYWLSFYKNGSIYDKRFIFLPGTISEENFANIPLMKTRGVLIKS